MGLYHWSAIEAILKKTSIPISQSCAGPVSSSYFPYAQLVHTASHIKSIHVSEIFLFRLELYLRFKTLQGRRATL